MNDSENKRNTRRIALNDTDEDKNDIRNTLKFRITEDILVDHLSARSQEKTEKT